MTTMQAGVRSLGGVSLLAFGLGLGCGHSSSPQRSDSGGSSGAVAGDDSDASTLAGANSAGGIDNAGGSAGKVGASAGTDGVAGSGLVLGDSPTEACIAYVLAVCARQAECSGASNTNCLQVSFSCPDLTFAMGSTRTVADLQTCAATYKKMACDRVVAGELPACVTSGTVALGGACEFSSQCASLSCTGASACGQCIPSVQEGGDCSTAGSCAGLLYCAGKCQRPSAAGEACNMVSRCAGGSYCSGSTSTCAVYPKLGESCAEARRCSDDSYCAANSLVCKAYSGLGLPCGVDASSGEAAHCVSPLGCARTSDQDGTCVELPSRGQPCLLAPSGLPEAQSCAVTERCDVTQTPPLCAPLASKGQACRGVRCGDGLACLCPTNPGAACNDVPVCAQLQLKNGPCSAPGDICHPGFSCQAGTCQPLGSQGLFAATCGP